MTDCQNVEIRDMLPDFLHSSLKAADMARVEEHLRSCADCKEELELIEVVRALRPAVAVDVTKVAKAIPPYRRRPWLATPPLIRIAAGIALIAVGSASYSIVNRTILSDKIGRGESAAYASGNVAPHVADPLAIAPQLGMLDDQALAELLADLENMDVVMREEPRPIVKLPGEGD